VRLGLRFEIDDAVAFLFLHGLWVLTAEGKTSEY
jgi:hypothetical protein